MSAKPHYTIVNGSYPDEQGVYHTKWMVVRSYQDASLELSKAIYEGRMSDVVLFEYPYQWVPHPCIPRVVLEEFIKIAGRPFTYQNRRGKVVLPKPV